MARRSSGKPRGAIEVQGAKTVIRELVRMGDEYVSQVKRVHFESAQVIERRAEVLVPRRTGALAGTIRSTGTKRGGYVRAGKKSVPYAGPIHFGWPNRPNNAKEWRGGPIQPNPFLYAALESRRADVEERFWKALNKAQKRAGLK
jgi:hypothetical protein